VTALRAVTASLQQSDEDTKLWLGKFHEKSRDSGARRLRGAAGLAGRGEGKASCRTPECWNSYREIATWCAALFRIVGNISRGAWARTISSGGVWPTRNIRTNLRAYVSTPPLPYSGYFAAYLQ